MNWKCMVAGTLASLAAAGIALASAAAAPADTASSLSAVRRSIDAGNAKFLNALKAGDAKAYAALFAPDGIELPSGGGAVTRGRAAIAADEAESAKASKLTGGAIHTMNVYLEDGTAYETGTYSFDIVLPGKPARTILGRYFEIWEKQSDGAWLIKVDCGYPDKYKR
jgi:uncharacterized protein (TIGR02246 family)